MITYSNHFLEQIKTRNINEQDIENTFLNPDNIIIEDNLEVYQKIIVTNDKEYLLRIFVNAVKEPPVAVTAYKTSKIIKYYF